MDSLLERAGFEPSVPGESGFEFAREVRGRLFAGGNGIRTIGPAPAKGSLGSPWLHRSPTPERFVADSPVEGTGFEPSVPLLRRLFWALPIGDGGTKGGGTYRFRSETAMLTWSGSP